MKVTSCYKVNNGIIVIVPDGGILKTVRNTRLTANLVITGYGLALLYQGYEIPIPEEMFDYIAEHNVVTVYEQKDGEYVHPVAATIEINKNLLAEGTTIYKYERAREVQDAQFNV